MIGGAIITAAATILFGFTRPVAGVFSEEGSRLVGTSGMIAVGDGVLIAHTVQDSVNLARRIRHLRHGLLNKRRHVPCRFLARFVG
jgi:hypothetical protein